MLAIVRGVFNVIEATRAASMWCNAQKTKRFCLREIPENAERTIVSHYILKHGFAISSNIIW